MLTFSGLGAGITLQQNCTSSVHFISADNETRFFFVKPREEIATYQYWADCI